MLDPRKACLALALLVACRGGDVNEPKHRVAEIPITRVVLYQNGVGYFERRGRLSGDVFTLQIRPSQINDLLKSLTVIDYTKGRAVSVSLPLEKTGAQILSELPPQVRAASGLLDVLRVFRGARVGVDGKQGSVAGRIVGVENMQASATGEGIKADWRLTLKTDDNELRVIAVDSISRIDLQDRTLSVGLDQSLDVSLNEGNWKPITLSVRLAGERDHDLLASYIVEMPRWKPAYRLVMSAEGEPLLQGWAVVDNVSGEDWNGVQLSLVAGTPMSFIYDLHSPQFTRRVDLTPRGRTTAMAPPSDKPGVSTHDRLEKEFKRSRRSKRKDKAPPMSKKVAVYDEDYDEPAEEREFEERLEEQMAARVEGAVVGSLFRYDLKDPVTVPDRSSTLVAIVNKRVPGDDVVLFRPELTASYGESLPYRAIMFKNETGFALEKGPVTIYSGGTFVGEGFIERMEKKTTAFITYSIDGNVNMRSRDGTRREGLRLLKIVDGMIVSEVQEISTTTYEIENRHPKKITAFIKTALRTGWKLRNKPGDTIETPDSLFVPVSVGGDSTAELKVEWVKRVTRREGIDTSLSLSVLKIYMEAGKAPPEVAKKLEEVLTLKARMSDIDREVSRLQKQHDDTSRDQVRVRRNLKMLGKLKGNAKLRKELVSKLGKLERALGKLSGKLVLLSEERAGHEKKLIVIIRTISLNASN